MDKYSKVDFAKQNVLVDLDVLFMEYLEKNISNNAYVNNSSSKLREKPVDFFRASGLSKILRFKSK